MLAAAPGSFLAVRASNRSGQALRGFGHLAGTSDVHQRPRRRQPGPRGRRWNKADAWRAQSTRQLL